MTRHHTRHTIAADHREIAAVEQHAWRPWCLGRLQMELAKKGRHGVVAVDRGRVTGHMVYALKKSVVEVKRLAVDLTRRREGIGTALVQHALSRLDPYRRPTLLLPVPEWCDDVHAFLKAIGIPAATTVEGDGCDNYLFIATCEAYRPRRAKYECDGQVP